MYAELHCHSNFSFLDGASHPEELAEEAARLGLAALAITDHDGFYGVVRFAEAARALALPTVFGTELTLGAHGAPNGTADPPGEHLIVLAQGTIGYARLAKAISGAQLAGEKGAPRTSLAQLVDAARAPVHGHGPSPGNDHWFVLTGCRKGTVPAALIRDGPAAAEQALRELVDGFGPDRVLVELWDHGDPLDRHRNDALVQLAMRVGVEVVATNNVHYATPARRPLAQALAAVRARRSLDEIDGWLPAAPFAHLRSAAEQLRRFARWPGAVERTVDIAQACAFDLKLAAPQLPDAPVPEGYDDMSWLRELVRRGAAVFYPESHPQYAQAMQQIGYELTVIEQLGFPGYFLLLHDIVEFCRRSDIYCQGRGSAANSAVCYALGVTKADAVALGLLFERFLSPERDGPPDIDLDIEHQRREEVIQYVYERYGRDRAAQVANVITYRPRSALREMAKAAGVAPGQADALGKWVDRWAAGPEAFGELTDKELKDQRQVTPRNERRFERTLRDRTRDGVPLDGPASTTRPPTIPPLALELASAVIDFPRHLGIHSGGMVMADRPLVEFCPVEWARMEGRSVLQWDKDDCAAAGLVKFDLLGLGMLTMLHLAVDLVRAQGVDIDLATIPQEPEVYDLLCAADTVGVFQVESRAQMATLPRLRPRTFYDLVVEVALDPPRSDPGRFGAPVPAAPQRRGGGHVHPPAHQAVSGKDARGTAVPRTAHAARGRLRGFHRGRGRPAPAGDGFETQPGADGTDARTADGGDGRTRDNRRDRRGDLHEAAGVLELRFPREPLGELRLSRLFELVDQVPLPGRVRGVVVERAAYGVLLTALDRARCSPARCPRARSRPERVDARRNARTAPARRRAHRSSVARVSCGAVAPRGAARPAQCARLARRAARPHRRRTGGASLHRPRGLRAPVRARPSTRSRRWRLRARSRGASVSRDVPRSGPQARSVPLDRMRGAMVRSSRRCPASSRAPTRPRFRA